MAPAAPEGTVGIEESEDEASEDEGVQMTVLS